MKNLKKISREGLKNVKGGECTYKCCWKSQPDNCSSTITASPGESVSCVEGAQLVLLDS